MQVGGNLTGSEMKIYEGIDMAKDKFDYCTMDDDMNVLYRGDNCSNSTESSDSFGRTLHDLKQITGAPFHSHGINRHIASPL